MTAPSDRPGEPSPPRDPTFDALARVQAAIAGARGDRDAILATLVDGALEAVPAAEGGVLELIDGDALEYRAVGGTLVPHRGLRVPLVGSLAGRCAETRAALRVDDARLDPHVAQDLIETLGLRAALLAPILHGGEVLGVLKLQSHRPAAFGPQDLDRLRLFAGAASAGLTEVRAAEAQRALTASAERQQAIFDGTTEFAVIVTDPRGRVTEWNTGAARILGWSAEAMRGETVERMFVPEDRAAGRPEAEMRQALAEGRADDHRWHLRADGSRFRAAGEMTVLRDGLGRHAGFVKILYDRTAEHAADRALEGAEARLRRAQEAGGVGLFTVDVADSLLVPTPEFCRLYGLPVQEFYPARVFEERVIAQDAHLVSSAASRARGEPHLDVEYRIRRADTGELRWIARKGEVEFDGEGRPVRFVGVARDVTERRDAEERLRASESLAREHAERVQLALTAGAIIGTWFWDLPVDRFTVDEAFARAFGLDPALGREGLSLEQVIATVHPADRAGLIAAIDAAIAQGGAYAHQYRVRRADGRYYWLEANGRVDHAPDGTPLRFPGVLIDVEERRAVAAERDRVTRMLRELNETLEAQVAARTAERDQIWLTTPDLLCVASFEGRLVSLNPAWSATLGWSGDELRGRAVLDLVHPDDRAATQARLAGLARGEAVLGFENRFACRDGGLRWLSWNAAARDGLIYATVRDVTAAKQQAEALAQVEEALRQAQKMEAVGQLTGGLAHDFNNLLAGISGSLELMETRIGQGRVETIGRYMAAAQDATKRAAALTHRLLAFSRRQTLAPRPTDVNRLVAELEDLIQRTVGPAVRVEVRGAPGLWTALIDPNQLENALLNLCINARDAMPEGGRITIETGNRWLDAGAARERDLEPGPYLTLSVADTGTGMPPEVIAKAFDPFFTTKPIGQGTGLGLSMIYGFAKQSGGQVRIASEVGAGTTVSLDLPRHLGVAEGGAAGTGAAPAVPAQVGETVLVVDDEPTVRMLVTDVLEDLGYAALEAADGAAGLAVLRSDVRIDLLVTDVGLPGGMNGRQMADAARVGRPDLKVLFITGYAENAVLGAGHLAPGMHVMTKPFAVDGLAARIRAMIGA